VVASKGNLLVYGENINNGSKIVGIARGLEKGKGYQIVNVGNCESTHIGLGLGMLMRGGKALLIAKQLDFMLLGIDQLVNTLNSIREMPNHPNGSFTILAVVCDQGYQGPQSSFNSAELIGDLCNCDVFFINDPYQAENYFSREIGKPGFRILLLSQRLFGEGDFEKSIPLESAEGKVFQHFSGSQGTILCFNFSLPQGKQLRSKFLLERLEYSLFSCSYPLPPDFVDKNIGLFNNNVVLVDDSKVRNGSSYMLAYLLLKKGLKNLEIVKRSYPISYAVNSDAMIDLGIN
jgi:hypothetical protein